MKKLLLLIFWGLMIFFPVCSIQADGDWQCPDISESLAPINDDNGDKVGYNISLANTAAQTEDVSFHVINRNNVIAHDWEGNISAGQTIVVPPVMRDDAAQSWSFDTSCNTLP